MIDSVLRALIIGLGALLAARTAVAGEPRVVSINPCVDAVLMEVADARQIAGISHYSQDPAATSIRLDLARRFPATSGTAEEVVALAPDVVIAGGHVAPSTSLALRRLGVRLIELPVPTTIAESEAQVGIIAATVRHPERGAALVARIDAAVSAARPPSAPPLSALIWQGGGLVPGRGTLADELLRVSGFRNASADYGLKQWDILPLEYLVAQPPRVLLSLGAEAGGGDRMLRHPVLRPLAARIAFRAFPARLLYCGGPTLVESLATLAAIRRGIRE